MTLVYLSASGQLGGAEICLLDVLAVVRQARPDWQLMLVLGEDGPLRARASALGVAITLLPFPKELRTLGDSAPGSRAQLAVRLSATAPAVMRYRRKLSALLKRLRPDTIHSNGFKMHVLAAWSRPAGVPLIWHFHDYISNRAVMARLIRRFAGKASAIIAVSESVAADLRKACPGADLPIRTLFNAVDSGRFGDQKTTIDLDQLSGLSPAGDDVVRVGLVATMAWWKGHKNFIDAIARLDGGLPLRAYIVGGQLYQTDFSQQTVETLRNYANSRGLAGRIGFTGFIADAPAALRSLDVVVHASTEPEPFGRVIAEAMACQRPVITSGLGGSAEVIAGTKAALVYKAGDSADLAKSIALLVRDPKLRASMGREGAKVARERFSLARLQAGLLGVYDSVLPKRPALPRTPRMRVLHLHSGNMLGGIESVMLTMARHRDACPDMEHHFALGFDGEFARRMRATGVPVHILTPARLRNPVSVQRARGDLRRLFKAHAFDVVMVHSPWSQIVWGTTVRAARIPLGFWVHGELDGRHWIQRLAKRTTPDFAICNSQFTAGTLPLLYPDLRSKIVYYPVEVPTPKRTRAEVRKSLGVSGDEVVVLHASRMEAWKGHENLLRAIAASKNSHLCAWIAGGPQTRAEETYFRTLKKLAADLGISNRVKFLGMRSDVPDLMTAADLFCQPNQSPEPFGVVFVEALASGLPVVSFNFGGAAEIVDDSCGIMLQPGDVTRLTTALDVLADTPEIRRGLALGGPKRAQQLCDPEARIRELQATLLEFTSKPSLARAVKLPG